LQRLRHPHIVQCEEVQWDAERRVVWLALEFMDGGDVQNLVENQRQVGGGAPFQPHFVRRVLASVGSALRYIHSQGVLHRDVKPANVLLTRCSQRIKLGDFGISKLLEATGLAHTVVGTPYYLSPEIVSGQAYGTASDAWALGVCLYELAALRRPFEAGNPLALVRRICEEPPLELPPETAADVHRAILGLLQTDPARRMTISAALTVSEAVAALSPPEASLYAASGGGALTPRGAVDAPLPLSPMCSQAAAFVVSGGDLSPVSMATTDSGFSSSPSESGAAELVASLCGGGRVSQRCPSPPRTILAQEVAPEGQVGNTAPCCGWQGSEAVAQARAALSADVDDPEELQIALLALEAEMPADGGVGAEAFQALSFELRLRIAALRADAAALLQSLLHESRMPPGDPAVMEQEQTTLIPAMNAGTGAAETVTTVCAGAAHTGESVAALETAMELASSLGIDTGFAEDRATSGRGLLSLRIVWGAFVRFLLLPIGVPFTSLLAEVASRFNLASGGGGMPLFELYWREGADSFLIRDQATWELCLQRRGLHRQPGRLELRLDVAACHAPTPRRRGLRGKALGAYQMPFVITGMRLPLAEPGVGGVMPGPLSGRSREKAAVSSARGSARGACQAMTSGRAGRPVQSAVQVGGGGRTATARSGRHRVHRRFGGGGVAVPLQGGAAVAAAASAATACTSGGWGVRRGGGPGSGSSPGLQKVGGAVGLAVATAQQNMLQLEGHGAQGRRGGA